MRPWQSPRIRRIELSSVFVLAKVHAKRELVLSEFTALDQMVEIVGVSNEINVHVCRRLNRKATLASADDFLELRTSRLDLPSSILGVGYPFISIYLDEIVVSSQDRSPLM